MKILFLFFYYVLPLPEQPQSFILMNNLTPVEICEAVALDFKRRKITHQKAGEMTGRTKATISNQVSGRKPFSKEMAESFSAAFGYSVDFLLYGRGPLMKVEAEGGDNVGLEDIKDGLDSGSALSLLEVCQYLLYLSGDKASIATWESLLNGDLHGYLEKAQELVRERNFPTNPPRFSAIMAMHFIKAHYPDKYEQTKL